MTLDPDTPRDDVRGPGDTGLERPTTAAATEQGGGSVRLDDALERGDDRATARPGDDRTIDRHGDDRPIEPQADDLATDRQADDTATERHGDDTLRQGDDRLATERHGDDRATLRQGDERATERPGDDGSPARLFRPEDAERFRAEWRDLQTRFVDDPKDAVRSADDLVTEVLQSLATTFSERKHELETRWRDGSATATEDLRVSLQRYRSFFDQLLNA